VASARQIRLEQEGIEIRIGAAAGVLGSSALGRIGYVGRSIWAAVRIEADGVKSRVHNPELVVFIEEGLLINDAGLDVVRTFDARNIGTNTCIGQSAILADRLLSQSWSQIREEIIARIVVELVPADEGAECEHGVVVDQACPRWSNIECL